MGEDLAVSDCDHVMRVGDLAHLDHLVVAGARLAKADVVGFLEDFDRLRKAEPSAEQQADCNEQP